MMIVWMSDSVHSRSGILDVVTVGVIGIDVEVLLSCCREDIYHLFCIQVSRISSSRSRLVVECLGDVLGRMHCVLVGPLGIVLLSVMGQIHIARRMLVPSRLLLIRWWIQWFGCPVDCWVPIFP